jgi:TetR/AcrR family transcriptional regulator, cholesterol catabolism regulator
MTRVAAAPQSVESMTDRQLQRRRALLEAVMQLAAERGVDNVQMKLVAESSGVALGTTYRYFASKEHLLASALADWHSRLADRVLEEPITFTSFEQRVDRLVDFLRRGLRGFARYPSYADLLLYVSGSRDPFTTEALNRMSGRNNRVLRFYLGSEITDEAFETLSFVVGSIWQNSILSWRSGRHPLDDAYRLCENGVRLACAGLQPIAVLTSAAE